MKTETSNTKEAKEPKAPAGNRRAPWFLSLFTFRFFSDEMPKISPHAVIDPSAEIAEDVEVGPFCVIGPQVKIDTGCRLLNNVTILGRTTIGKDNVFFPNSVIGAAPQDKKFKGETTELTIGNANVFREAVTIHVGTEKGGGITRVGDNGLYMVNAHIGHDATIGNAVVLSNNVMIPATSSAKITSPLWEVLASTTSSRSAKARTSALIRASITTSHPSVKWTAQTWSAA